MSTGNAIGSDPYDAQIDRLNYLIYAQEMIIHLRQDNMISGPKFLEKWNYYEQSIKGILDFLRNEGFIILFESEYRPLFSKAKKASGFRIRNRY